MKIYDKQKKWLDIINMAKNNILNSITFGEVFDHKYVFRDMFSKFYL